MTLNAVASDFCLVPSTLLAKLWAISLRLAGGHMARGEAVMKANVAQGLFNIETVGMPDSKKKGIDRGDRC